MRGAKTTLLTTHWDSHTDILTGPYAPQGSDYPQQPCFRICGLEHWDVQVKALSFILYTFYRLQNRKITLQEIRILLLGILLEIHVKLYFSESDSHINADESELSS